MVHLGTPDGRGLASGDGGPVGGSYPTTRWRAGDDAVQETRAAGRAPAVVASRRRSARGARRAGLRLAHGRAPAGHRRTGRPRARTAQAMHGRDGRRPSAVSRPRSWPARLGTPRRRPFGRWSAHRPLAALIVAFLVLAAAWGVIVPVFEAPDGLAPLRPATRRNRRPRCRRSTRPRAGLGSRRAASPHPTTCWPRRSARWLGPTWPPRIWWSIPQNSIGSPRPGRERGSRFIHPPDEEGWPWHGHVLAMHLGRALSTLMAAATVALGLAPCPTRVRRAVGWRGGGAGVPGAGGGAGGRGRGAGGGAGGGADGGDRPATRLAAGLGGRRRPAGRARTSSAPAPGHDCRRRAADGARGWRSPRPPSLPSIRSFWPWRPPSATQQSGRVARHGDLGVAAGRVADGHDDRRTLLVLAVTAGLAPVAKLSGMAVAAFAVATLGGLAWRRRDARWLVRVAAPVAVVTVVASGWWYVRNLVLYGDATGLSHMLLPAIRRDFEFGRWLAGLPAELTGTWFSTWGLFGWFTILMPDWFYALATVAAAVAILGVAAAAARRASWIDWPRLGWLVAWWVMVFVSLLRWLTIAKGGHGRLLFPAIAAAALVLAAGWRAALPTPLRPRLRRGRRRRDGASVGLRPAGSGAPGLRLAGDHRRGRGACWRPPGRDGVRGGPPTAGRPCARARHGGPGHAHRPLLADVAGGRSGRPGRPTARPDLRAAVGGGRFGGSVAPIRSPCRARRSWPTSGRATRRRLARAGAAGVRRPSRSDLAAPLDRCPAERRARSPGRRWRCRWKHMYRCTCTIGTPGAA